MTYDALGNLLSVTDAMGIVTSVSEYDSMGRVTKTADALGLVVQYSYEEAGKLLEAVEKLNGQNNRVTSYGYDGVNRLIQVFSFSSG